VAVIRLISLRERLILNYVIVSILAILLAGALSYYVSRKALMERTFQQLTSVKMVKKNQVEGFLLDQIRDVKMLSNTRFVRQIAGNSLQKDIPNQCEPGVSYIHEYLESNPYCQEIFIGQRGKTDGILFRRGDSRTAQVLHSDSLGIPTGIFDRVLDSGEVIILDTMRGERAGLVIVMPVKTEFSIPIHVIGARIDATALDTIMLEYDDSKGLGKSGESYLVGKDHRLRTSSRFSSDYFKSASVSTTGVKGAFSGMEGTGAYKDYRGVDILGSYGLITTAGLNWAILAEIDYQEAMVPIFRLRSNILLLTLFIALGVFLLTFFISRKITRPLIELKNAVTEIREGRMASVELPAVHDEVRELAERFNQMAMELGIKRNELLVERLQKVRAMIDGQEQERQRLSRELHDGIGQYMAALKMRMQSIPLSDSNQAARKIEEISHHVDLIIEEIRRVTFDLRPALLNEIGLRDAIRTLCTTASRPGSTTFGLISEELPSELSLPVQTYVFRIIQEGIHNILKHSNASRASIAIKTAANRLLISIDDDGNGFDTAASMKGSGLHNIRERVNLLSGTIEITSIANKGTSIRISIPFEND
jgi:two-component system NarL family sensor kinase